MPPVAPKKDRYDVAVLGGGPGGYVAAIRAAQLGLAVACVERERLGGICLNWGCIPTKALLRSADVYDLVKRAERFGVHAENVSFDLPAIVKRSRDVAGRLERNVGALFKKYGVEHLVGEGALAPAGAPGGLVLADGVRVRADRVLLATGARAKGLGPIQPDGQRIVTYKEAMLLDALPATMVVIGAGAIGIEFAYYFGTLGTKVTVVELLPQILPVEDEEIAGVLRKSLERRGVRILTGARVQAVEAGGVRVAAADGQEELVPAERVLLAVGVQANTEGLGLEARGIATERGFIVSDPRTYETAAAGVYAIGDCRGGPLLAHKAMAEGVACVERIAGHETAGVPYDAIPGCTYCQPQVASIGLTEKAARAAGRDFIVGRYPFAANGRSLAVGETEGLVKVLLDRRTGEVIGAHIVGHDASDLIAEMSLAKSGEQLARDVLHAVHAHPTLSEAVMEATAQALGESVHI